MNQEIQQKQTFEERMMDKAVQAGAGEAVLRALDSKFYDAISNIEMSLRQNGILK